MSLKSYITDPKSGTGIAAAASSDIKTLASLADGKTNGVVLIQVASTEAAGVEVIAVNNTTGLLVANDGNPVSFFCDDLAKILVKRQGGADITFRFFAF